MSSGRYGPGPWPRPGRVHATIHDTNRGPRTRGRSGKGRAPIGNFRRSPRGTHSGTRTPPPSPPGGQGHRAPVCRGNWSASARPARPLRRASQCAESPQGPGSIGPTLSAISSQASNASPARRIRAGSSPPESSIEATRSSETRAARPTSPWRTITSAIRASRSSREMGIVAATLQRGGIAERGALTVGHRWRGHGFGAPARDFSGRTGVSRDERRAFRLSLAKARAASDARLTGRRSLAKDRTAS
jgi:hypothetical protein